MTKDPVVAAFDRLRCRSDFMHFDKWISDEEWVKCIILHGGHLDLSTYTFNNAMAHSYGLQIDQEGSNDIGVYRHLKHIRRKCIRFYFVSKHVHVPSQPQV
jgi:hypothetical protein